MTKGWNEQTSAWQKPRCPGLTVPRRRRGAYRRAAGLPCQDAAGPFLRHAQILQVGGVDLFGQRLQIRASRFAHIFLREQARHQFFPLRLRHASVSDRWGRNMNIPRWICASFPAGGIYPIKIWHDPEAGVCLIGIFRMKYWNRLHEQNQSQVSLSPSWDIPKDRHFWKRQYWHLLRFFFWILQERVHRSYSSFIRTVRRKKPWEGNDNVQLIPTGTFHLSAVEMASSVPCTCTHTHTHTIRYLTTLAGVHPVMEARRLVPADLTLHADPRPRAVFPTETQLFRQRRRWGVRQVCRKPQITVKSCEAR